MKKNGRVLLLAPLLSVLMPGCFSETDVIEKPLTQHPARGVSDPANPTYVECAGDEDCGIGMICESIPPELSQDRFCLPGCRYDDQCGIEGHCVVDTCAVLPCPGNCTISPWQQAVDILGFEDATKWTATSGTDTSVSDAVQGQSALAVNGPGWQFVLTSDPFGPLPMVDDDVSVAIKLPEEQPNPWWYGQLQLYVESRALGLYNRFVGIAELTGLPTGEYVTVNFALPPDVRALLQGNYNDLKVTLALNVPYDATGQYLLDDLRFGNDIIPPVVTVATNEKPVYGRGPFDTFKEDITLLGHIQEDGGIADVLVSIDGGAPVHPVPDADGYFSVPMTLARDNAKVSTTYSLSVTAIDTEGNETTISTKISVLSFAIPDEVLVMFNRDTTESRRGDLIADFGGVLSRRLNNFTWLVTVPTGTASDVIANVNAPTAEIALIYPNILLESQDFIPNDSDLSEQEDYLEIINAFKAWEIERGSEDVIVAVCDSGVDAGLLMGDLEINGCNTTPEFVDNVYVNEAECCATPPCPIDDDHSCRPNSDPTVDWACPVADLNGDGCPGVCGVDDDNDGAADMADPDVQRLFSNGYDDDGDGIVDEQAKVGNITIACTDVNPGDLVGAPEDGDCDGAANDDDENGYPDDCRGWNFGRPILPACPNYTPSEDGTCMMYTELNHPNMSIDIEGFGTGQHGNDVAQLLGEPGNDCDGHTGVAHRVKILPLTCSRYFPPNGDNAGIIKPDLASTFEAYQYAAKAGAHIINSSLNAGSNFDGNDFFDQFPSLDAVSNAQLITNLLNLSGSDKVLHVVAAGNNGIDLANIPFFPAVASVENMLVVAGSLKNDGWYDQSNYGLQVDLAAPAYLLMSDHPAYALSGTSFAAPMVAGAAALLLSSRPELRGNPALAAAIIRDSARKVDAWKNKSLSEGILDIYAALQAAVPEEIFIDVSDSLLPSPQDNATNDIDMFDADQDGQMDMILEVMCSNYDSKFQPHLRVADNGVFKDSTVDMMPSFTGSFCDAAEGDLDGDGKTDIVLAARQMNGTNGENQNRILMNNGHGFDLDDSVIPSNSQLTRAVELCDFDADGDLDIFFGNIGSGGSYVLLENNGGNFTDVTSSHLNLSGFANMVHKVLCVDLDEPPSNLCDGLSDDECDLCADPKISVDGMVAAGLISNGDKDACFNTRGKVIPELVLAGGEGTSTVLFRQDSSGVYQDASCDLNLPNLTGASATCDDSTRPSRQDYDVESGDFNNDGLPDLVFVSRSGKPNPSNTLLFNNGDGSFRDVTADKWLIVPDDSREVEVGDVNGDDLDDIVVIRGNPNTMNAGTNTLYVNMGDGTMQYEAASGLRANVSITTDGDLVDFDGDGDLDLILGVYSEPNILLQNQTN